MRADSSRGSTPVAVVATASEPDPLTVLLEGGATEVRRTGWRSALLALGLAVVGAVTFAGSVLIAVLVLTPFVGPAAVFPIVWSAFTAGHVGAPP